MSLIDEQIRRRFERHRRAGGTDPLERFLPDDMLEVASGTLEEVVLIDLEFRWKAWHHAGAVGPPPSLVDYDDRLPALKSPTVRARLAEQSAWLVDHYHPAALRAGARLEHYVLEERLGTGASADVWRARDEKLERDVALKIPHASLISDAAQIDRARREALAAARLRHPGIVMVHGVGEHDGRPFFVLELVRGPTLAEVLRRDRLQADDASRLVARLADAISYAHGLGVVHRDLKPSNILLEEDAPRITDFGLAHLATGRELVTHQGEILGTPAYMAPEQARGDVKAVGATTDVYALGVLLYELLSGVRPFQAPTVEAMLYSVVHDRPASLADRGGDIPADLVTITEKAMARRTERRYPSAAALASDLRRFLDRRPIRARPVGRFERAALFLRRNPALSISLLVSLLAILAVAGIGFTNVLRERGRFRAERDRAERHLVRSLLGEADALREAQRIDWQAAALDRLERAAPLVHDRADRVRLRTLLAATLGSTVPSLHRVGVAHPAAEAARCIVPNPTEATVALITRDGALRLASASLASAEARRITLPAKATSACWSPRGDRLCIGCDDGSLHLVAAASGERVPTGSAGAAGILVLAAHHATGLVAVGRMDGSIDVLRWDAAGMTLVATLRGHAEGIHALQFSPSGQRLLSGGADRTTRVWDPTRGALLLTATGLDAVRHVAFLDDRWALTSTFEQYGFHLLDTHTGAQPAQLDPGAMHARPVTGLVSGTREQALTVASDGSLSIWRIQRHGDRVRFRLVHRGNSGLGPVTACARLLTSGDLIAAHADGTVSRWRLQPLSIAQPFETGQEAAFIPGRHDLATSRGFSTVSIDGKRSEQRFPDEPLLDLVTAGQGRLLGLSAGGRLMHLDATGRVLADASVVDARRLALLADGTILLAQHDTLSLGSLADLKAPLRRLRVTTGPVFAVAASADGAGLVLTGRGLLRVTAGGQTTWLDRRPRSQGAVAAGDLATAVTSPGGGGIEVWSGAAATPSVMLHEDGGATVRALAIDAAGTRVYSLDARGMLRCFDVPSGTLRWSSAAPRVPPARCGVTIDREFVYAHRGGTEVLDIDTGVPVASIAVYAAGCWHDADNERIWMAGRAGGVWGVDLARLRTAMDQRHEGHGVGGLRAVPSLAVDSQLVAGGHPDSVWGVDASADGRWIATSGYQGLVAIREAETGGQVGTLHAPGRIAWTVAFAPDGRSLAVGMGEEICLYSVPGLVLRGTLKGHAGLVTSLAFHPTRPLLASTSQDHVLRLWDPRRSRSLGTLDTEGAVMAEIEFHPAGHTLAGVSADGNLLLWACGSNGPTDGARPGRRLPGHATAAWTLAYDRTGAWLATGSEDGHVILRDTRDGEEVLSLRGNARLRSLSFSYDGRYLAGACWDAPGRVWDLHALAEHAGSLHMGWR